MWVSIMSKHLFIDKLHAHILEPIGFMLHFLERCSNDMYLKSPKSNLMYLLIVFIFTVKLLKHPNKKVRYRVS